MIDYEKLKLAHELAYKYSQSKEWDHLVYIGVGMSNIELRYTLTIYDKGQDLDIRFDDGCQFTYEIDDLITKLQSLTETKSKYAVGSIWWCLGSRGAPFEVEITGKMGGNVDVSFPDGTCRYAAVNELHPSKQALIQAQIDYWHELMLPKVNPEEFEQDCKELSSCCSLHTGTTEECQPGYISETLEEILGDGRSVSLPAGEIRIINDKFYKIKETHNPDTKINQDEADLHE